MPLRSVVIFILSCLLGEFLFILGSAIIGLTHTGGDPQTGYYDKLIWILVSSTAASLLGTFLIKFQSWKNQALFFVASVIVLTLFIFMYNIGVPQFLRCQEINRSREGARIEFESSGMDSSQWTQNDCIQYVLFPRWG